MTMPEDRLSQPPAPGRAVPHAAGVCGPRLLDDAQLRDIHCAALEILRRTGVRVHNAEARDLLREAGCVVSDTTLVRFPPAVVEQALERAPSRVVLCDREGEPRLFLEGERTHFGTGSDLPHTIDLESGERRPSRLADVAAAARLADALPHLDFIMSAALPSDVPSPTSDRRSFLAMLENSRKPIVFTAWDEVGLSDIVTMAERIAGDPAELALKPFLLAYLEPTSPLQHSDTALRKLLRMAERGLPVVYAPGPVEGASAPVTPAGSLAMATAEVLSGLAIAQLRRPGAPFVWGSGSGPLDMRTMVATYASPEFMLHCSAMAELAHRLYRLPVWGFAGCSDSKRPDAQAGIESALWILWAALCGNNLIHDVGYLESGLTGSLEMIVLSNELIGFVRRLLAGISVTPETLALETIDAVGTKADYLAAAHTKRHYREVWYPRLLDRSAHHAWMEAGRPEAIGTARELARKTLAEHRPASLPPAVLDDLRGILAQADERAGLPRAERVGVDDP
jgi:trimethylamine---corrinoid protein Co-methyltransferase